MMKIMFRCGHASMVSRLAQAFLVVIMIASCGGPVPTQEEIKQDTIENRAQQLVRVGDTTREAGDLASAMQLYQRAADMNADWSEPYLKIGETALSAGLYPKALVAFEEAARIAPTDNNGHNGAGVSLDLMGRHEDAQERYITGMEQAPDNVPLKNNLGLSLALIGEYSEAIEILREIANLPDASARTRLNLALVYGLAGYIEEAKKMAAIDLDEAQVANNVAFYAKLRKMDLPDRTKAVFGALR